MRFLTITEVIQLYRLVMESSGGTLAILSLEGLESAVAQPRATFGGNDLYPSVVQKAAALGFSLVMGHPFVDGKKRIGHAAMEVFLILNGFEIDAPEDEQETTILQLASGHLSRDAFISWLEAHTRSSEDR